MSPRYAQNLLATLIAFLLLSCSRQDPLAESQKLIQQFDYAGARKILERVVAKDSTNVGAMAMLLRVLWLGNDTTRFEAMRKSIVHPGNPNLLLALALCFYEIGDFTTADSLLHLLSGNEKNDERIREMRKRTRVALVARHLVDSAYIVADKGQYRVAFELYSQAVPLWLSINHIMGQARTFSGRAFAQQYLGNLKGLEADAQASKRLSAEAGSLSLQAQAFLLLGILHDRKSEYDSATMFFERAVQAAKTDGSRSLETRLRAQLNKGSVLESTGNVDGAKAIYYEVLSESEPFEHIQMITLFKLGRACKLTASYEEAIDYYERSLRIAKKRGNVSLEAFNLAGIGDSYFFQDKYELALKFRMQSRSLNKQIGLTSAALMDDIGIIQILTFMGRYEEASQRSRVILPVAESLGEPDIIMRLKFVIAQNCQSQQAFPEAEQLYLEVLRLARKTETYELALRAAQALVNIYYESGSVRSSTSEVESLLVAARAENEHIAQQTNMALARLLVLRRDYARAMSLLDEVFSHALQYVDLDLAANTRDTKGDIYEMMGQYAQADDCYAAALRIYDQITNSIEAEADIASYRDRIRYQSEKRMLIAYRMRLPDSLLLLSNNAKGRVFLSLMSDRINHMHDDTVTKGVSLNRTFRDSISLLTRHLSENAQQQNRNTEFRSQTSTSKALESVRTHYSQFLYEQELKHPPLSSIGLTRAFLYAGASGVVSTLWKVDDKASMEFMRRYYKHLQKTADIAEALALAQREFSSDPQYRHPYYWAAYVLTGF